MWSLFDRWSVLLGSDRNRCSQTKLLWFYNNKCKNSINFRVSTALYFMLLAFILDGFVLNAAQLLAMALISGSATALKNICFDDYYKSAHFVFVVQHVFAALHCLLLLLHFLCCAQLLQLLLTCFFFVVVIDYLKYFAQKHVYVCVSADF